MRLLPGLSNYWPTLDEVRSIGTEAESLPDAVLLTVKALPLGAACGVLAVACLMRWLWHNDRHIAQREVDAGAGLMLPTYVAGPSSHGWWAAVLLAIVLGMIFLMAMFAYLYLLGAQPQGFRTPPPQGALLPGLALLAASAGGAFAARPALARLRRGSGISAALMAGSMLCLLAALALDAHDWWQAGLRGETSGQAAAIWALLAWHAVITLAVVLSALFYLLRWMRGLAPGPANKTLEVLRVIFIYAALEGTAALLLPRWVVPGGLA